MPSSYESRFRCSDFLDSPHERLNRLKQLLDFTYEPASIWKELLQNAEDAGARQLHFLILPPQDKPSHPFLGVPLLCALNDGAFSTDDARAIARMGLGTKGANEDAIGKFGLGMKGVFNLGEVLFYFASSGQKAAREQHSGATDAPFGQALNPYQKLEEHKEWKLDDGRTFAPLMRRLLEKVREHRACQNLESSQWFALVLPLRDEATVPRASALVQNYPTPASLFPADLEERLVALFPMLRNLQSVSVWREGDIKKPWFCVSVEEEARRSQKPTALSGKLGQVQPFGAALYSTGSKRTFEGQEVLLDLNDFAGTGILERSQNLMVQSEGEVARLQQEKFTPHAAAVWLDGTAKGQLQLRPAVWLPLPDRRDFSSGRSDAQDIFAPGTRGFQLTLHGNFFIDDGRRNLVFNATNAEGELPQSRWNKQLLEQGTLPLVLPALEAFIAQCHGKQKPDELEVREITRALGHAHWFIENPRAALTSGGNWIYRLSGPPKPDLTVSALIRRKLEKTATLGAWKVEAADEFWILPAPPEGEAAGALENPAAKIFEWLPALDALCRSCVIIWDWPRFTREQAQVWSEEQVTALLKNSKGESWFGSAISLRYFVGLLQSFESELSDAVWERVVTLAKQALRVFPFGVRLKDEVVEVWKEFWALVPRRFWLPFEIGISETSAENRRLFLAGLQSLGLERTPVPVELTPKVAPLEGDDGKWSAADAAQVARWFGGLLASEQPLSEVVRALHLVENTSGDLEAQFAAIGEYALFKTKEWHEVDAPRTGVTRSWRELRELRESSRLWRDAREGGGEWLRDWCGAVQVRGGVAANFIVSIEEGATQPISSALWPRRDRLDRFGAGACLELLQTRPDLRDIKGRAILAPRLFDARLLDGKPANQRAVRYLLHGRADHFEDGSTPLIKEARGSETWHRLALVAIPASESWTLIPSELSTSISDDIASLIEVKPLDRTSAIDILRRRQSELSELEFGISPVEREEVLRDFSGGAALFRALPLHEVWGRDGTRVTFLPERCFLQGADIPLPPELRGAQTLIARPDDSRLRAAYEGFGIGEFERQSVLELALLHDAPLTTLVLETLDKLHLDEINADILALLRDTSWIDMPRGAFAPAAVVNLPRASSQTEIICQSESISFTELERQWGHYAGWKKLEKLWPDTLESAQLLRAELVMWAPHHEQFALGKLGLGATLYSDLPQFLEGWGRSGAALPLGVTLLKALGEADVQLVVASALLQSVAAQTLADWGREVSQVARNAPDSSRDNPLVALHFWLFEAWAAHAETKEARQDQLRGWFFPSQNEVWCEGEKLTRAAQGVQKSALLHGDWANVLGRYPALCRSLSGTFQRTKGNDWDELKAEMASWETTEPLKSALVAIMGAPPEQERECEKLCANGFGTGGNARLKVWEKLGGISNSAASDLAQARNRPFYFRFVDGAGDTDAINLLGETRKFPLEADNFNSLLVGSVEPVNAGWQIKLRRMNGHPRSRSRTAMNDLVIETMRALLKKRDKFKSPTILTSDDQHQSYAQVRGAPVNYRLSARLDECAREWSNAEQIDLEVAQNFMIDNAFFYFRTLGGQKAEVAKLMRAHDDWRYEKHSEIKVEKLRSRNGWEPQQSRVEATEQLRRAMESKDNDAFARETLQMVRAKIRDNGYEMDSVPFELFQNADDCANERFEADESDDKTAHLAIELSSDGRVSWTHWGRKMNVKGAYGNVLIEEARRRGYGRDLEKMLILQASDKSGHDGTTGKFGLGFKSVYLVCERPRVESGELRFEVRGGFYPQKIAMDGALDRQGTRLSFEVAPGKLTPIFADFWRVLPLQLVFSRRINQCDFRVNGGDYCFKLERRQLSEDAQIVTLRGAAPWPLESGDHTALPTRVLLLGKPNEGVLALGLGERGALPLPADVPCFWNTTPTRVMESPGYAINADWQIDVGRAQLAGGDANMKRARNLGASWRGQIERLVRESAANWPQFREQMGFDSHLIHDEFWRDVTQILSAPETQTNALLREIFDPHKGVLAPLRKWAPLAVTPAATIEISAQIPEVKTDLRAIVEWWKSAEIQHLPTDESLFFPSGLQVYDLLDADNLADRRRAWLTLLLRSSLESVGRTDDSQKRGFIGFCAQSGGWLERFAAPSANVTRLGQWLEDFLERDHKNHQWLHLLRHSLPVFALARWLDDYILILSRQDKRHKFADLRFDGGFALGLDVPDVPQLGKVLGRGTHFLLRELVRVGFVEDERAHKMCFHPTSSLRRFLEPYNASFSSDMNALDASKLAHTILQRELGEEAHFNLCFDIPLVLWVQGKNL